MHTNGLWILAQTVLQSQLTWGIHGTFFKCWIILVYFPPHSIINSASSFPPWKYEQICSLSLSVILYISLLFHQAWPDQSSIIGLQVKNVDKSYATLTFWQVDIQMACWFPHEQAVLFSWSIQEICWNHADILLKYMWKNTALWTDFGISITCFLTFSCQTESHAWASSLLGS